jgi:hypothetical protein
MTASLAIAQEVIHALAGTVKSIDSKAMTIEVNTDDGSDEFFKALTRPVDIVDYDKKMTAGALPARTFNKDATHVIVYYFGDGTIPTAVAFQDLGTGPLEKDSGTVLNYDRHHHLLTIETKQGVKQSFEIGPKSVAETAVGAVEGYKYDPERGDQVRVTSEHSQSNETALFIRAD